MRRVTLKLAVPGLVTTVLVLAVLLAGPGGSATGSTVRVEAPQPIVTVIRRGGYCVVGSLCRTVLRIGDTTISGEGYAPRALKPRDRRALLAAIGRLDAGYLRTHPFTGTCPTAYDGRESVYRFRGFPGTL